LLVLFEPVIYLLEGAPMAESVDIADDEKQYRQKHEEWARNRVKPTPDLAAEAPRLLERGSGNPVEPGDELPEGYRRKRP